MTVSEKKNTYRIWLVWPPSGWTRVDIEADSLEEAEREALDIADELVWEGICGDCEGPEINDAVLLGRKGEYLLPFVVHYTWPN